MWLYTFVWKAQKDSSPQAIKVQKWYSFYASFIALAAI
jgi:hypothetical protein